MVVVAQATIAAVAASPPAPPAASAAPADSPGSAEAAAGVGAGAGAGQVRTAVTEKDEHPFFHYYGLLPHQQNMLQDAVRTGTYQQAIVEVCGHGWLAVARCAT